MATVVWGVHPFKPQWNQYTHTPYVYASQNIVHYKGFITRGFSNYTVDKQDKQMSDS